MLGAKNTGPTPTAGAGLKAPVAAAKPMGAAGPMDVAKNAQAATDFQSVVDEAAIIFASGDEKTASDLLIDFLKQSKGQADRKVWFVLLDIYHAMGDRERFEQLALMFANRFQTSPPSWESGDEGDKKEAAPAGAAAGSAGKNVLIVDGAVNEGLAAKAKEFISAAKETKSCKIDVSRMKMDQSDMAGLAALQAIMAQLRKHKVSATLMGENHVATWLTKKVESTKEQKDIQHSPCWLLLLEILQWRGLMEQFEELSFEYTMTFELSGPGWEESGVMTIEAVNEPVEEAAEANDDMIQLESDVTDVSLQRIQEQITAALKDKGEAKLNFKKVQRMQFSSAGAFLGFVSGLGPMSKKVILDGPSELIVALLDVVGFSQLVTIIPRKR